MFIKRYSRIYKDCHLIRSCLHDLFVDLWRSRVTLTIPNSVQAYLGTCLQRRILKQIKISRNIQPYTQHISEKETTHSIEDEIIFFEIEKEQFANISNVFNLLTRGKGKPFI